MSRPLLVAAAVVFVAVAAACDPRPSEGAKAPEVRSTSIPVPDSAPPRDSIIGRDSAFGPRFRIDSTGRITPIKKP
ncbi:MAG: hypothetical protein ACYC0B_00525 [Gemmatimonadaceae bacterium]